MKLDVFLTDLLRSGIHRIGEIEIETNDSINRFKLFHYLDQTADHCSLETHYDPQAARDISTYSPSGEYRFTKGEVSLKRGWIMTLESIADLRLALDHFYPASIGLLKADLSGRLNQQNLRDKLDRQTGMYRSAKFISDEGAQELVKTVCGPAHRCAKRILWQIDSDTPLEDSEASRFDGIATGLPASEAIPLLCQEACNHFVSECRKVSKSENDAKKRTEPA